LSDQRATLQSTTLLASQSYWKKMLEDDEQLLKRPATAVRRSPFAKNSNVHDHKIKTPPSHWLGGVIWLRG
jgi:hypothetical protein